MAKRTHSTRSAPAKSTGAGQSDTSRVIVQLGALVLVIGLVVYLLVGGFTGENDASSPNASESANGDARSTTSGDQQAGVEELPAAPITLEPAFIDFGRVPPNTMHTRQVILTNTGSSTVRIIDARPSCPCTTVNRHANSISPGQSITLDIEMDSESRIGPKSVAVNIIFAGYEQRRLSINATVSEDPA